MTTPPKERLALLASLGAVGLAALAILLALRGHLEVPLAAFVAIVAAWSGLAAFLWTHRTTCGREGRYLDLWSIPHFFGGVLPRLLGLSVIWVIALALAWELAERTSRVPETRSNRVIDVALAVLGWIATDLLLAIAG